MSGEIIKIEKIKASVESSAWNYLDGFFKKTNPDSNDHDKAKIAIMAISTKIKSDSLELDERRLTKELK
jgi:hypothetical protein